MGVVTISSSYGAGGATIGPTVAQKLGVDFFDRAIPVAVAHELALNAEEVLEYDERPPRRLERMLQALASSVIPLGPDPSTELMDNPRRIREATETLLRSIADGNGAVVLGRAAMVVLGKRPDVLCVRLDGPAEARITSMSELTHIDIEIARQAQRETDGAREAYSQSFYGVSQSDASLYHLILDSTAIDHDACVEIIVTAARARFEAATHG
jgi:cytidylate kinase